MHKERALKVTRALVAVAEDLQEAEESQHPNQCRLPRLQPLAKYQNGNYRVCNSVKLLDQRNQEQMMATVAVAALLTSILRMV